MEAAVVFIFVLLMMGLFGFVIYVANKQTAKNRTLMAQLAGYLERTTSEKHTEIRGERGGLATKFHLTARGSGKHRVSWTDVIVELPRAYPLTLLVRHHGFFDDGKIGRGEMVDVKTDDPAFDQKYLVEAAPADVVRQLLNVETRSFLLNREMAELATIDEDGRRSLKLSVRGWLDTFEAATPAIDTAVQLASRVRDVFAAVDRAAAPVVSGDPYRPETDDAPQRQAAAAREAEVKRVETVRARRLDGERMTAILLLVGFVFFAVLLVAALD